MFIRVIDQDQMYDLPAENGTNLMALLRRHGHSLNAPCGGRGSCGKCLVEADGIGPVLACQTVLGQNLPIVANGTGMAARVRLPRKAKALILVDGLLRDQPLNPLVRISEATVPPPTLEDQQADDERFLQVTGCQVPFARLAELPDRLAAADGRVRFLGRTDTRTVLRFLPLQANGPVLGVAIDIGTTTLAAYLYDLNTGRRLASAAMNNPQAAFGADVISRIARAAESPAAAAELRQAITGAIGQLVVSLLNQAEKAAGRPIAVDDAESAFLPERIALLSLAGNTTMMHLLAGLPALNISRSPFNPVSVRAQVVPAAELGLTGFPEAFVILMPSVASYVGGDITAGVMALGLERPGHETAVLIDIGTNGEIVLRAGERLTACATAAGPAFEGANISCGMSGTAGAIDHVWLEDDDIRFTVIAGEAGAAVSGPAAPVPSDLPVGICGSGLVDLIAALLKSGVIDETGRIGSDEDRLSPQLRSRLTEFGGQPAFLLADTGETGHGRPVLLTQKDVRELQNAKAAIAAGIQLLLQREAVAPAAVRTVYLAGGFGQYLNVRSAQAIGLLPEGVAGQVIAVGNTSAMGAIAALLNHELIAAAEKTARTMVYRELSSDPEFSDLYIDALLFPEND